MERFVLSVLIVKTHGAMNVVPSVGQR